MSQGRQELLEMIDEARSELRDDVLLKTDYTAWLIYFGLLRIAEFQLMFADATSENEKQRILRNGPTIVSIAFDHIKHIDNFFNTSDYPTPKNWSEIRAYCLSVAK